MFTIGYDGTSAVVDGNARRRYGKLSTPELAARGLFRAAYCSALRSGSAAELDSVAEAYNRCAGTTYRGSDPSFARLFGVGSLPAEKIRTKIL